MAMPNQQQTFLALQDLDGTAAGRGKRPRLCNSDEEVSTNVYRIICLLMRWSVFGVVLVTNMMHVHLLM